MKVYKFEIENPITVQHSFNLSKRIWDSNVVLEGMAFADYDNVSGRLTSNYMSCVNESFRDQKSSE